MNDKLTKEEQRLRLIRLNCERLQSATLSVKNAISQAESAVHNNADSTEEDRDLGRLRDAIRKLYAVVRA